MRTKNIWKSLLMSAALLVSGAMVSCDKDAEEFNEIPVIKATVDGMTSYEIGYEGETVVIDVECNTTWSASLDDSYSNVALSTTATTATVVVGQTTEAREITVNFITGEGYMGMTKTAAVTIKQVAEPDNTPVVSGDGTLENPFSVSAAVAKAKEHGTTENDAGGPYYIKGIISNISLHFSDPSTTNSGDTVYYGNATFEMVDKDTTSPVFTAYQIYYLGGVQWIDSYSYDIEVGDEVVIYGKIYSYNGSKPETTGKGSAYLYSLNGITDDDAIEKPNESANVTLPYILDTNTLKGSNNSYASNCDVTYNDVTWNFTGNATMNPWRLGGNSLTNTDRTVYTKTAMIADIKAIELTHGTANDITVNSLTVIVSKNADFSSPVSTLTPQFAANTTTTIEKPADADWSGCYFKFVYNVTVAGTSNKFVQFSKVAFTDGTPVGNEPGGEDVEPTPVTVAEFNAAAESSTVVYQLTGTISGSINATYGNFDLVDETGSVYVYGLTATNLGYGASNDQSYGSLGLKSGDKITINGYRGSYGDKIEVMYAWFVEKVGEGGTTDPGTDPEPTPDPNAKGATAENPFTVADAIAKCKETGTTATTELYYIKGVISYVTEAFGSYGNATFNMTDEGSSDVLVAFRVKYFNNQGWTDGQENISKGDVVIVHAPLFNYNGTTPETATGGYLYQIVEKGVVEPEAEPVYFLDSSVTGGSNGYATQSQFEVNGLNWNITGNTTLSPWRLGGKSLTNENREIYSETALNKTVNKVVINHGTNNGVTVNSCKFIVASDANFSNVVSEVPFTYAASGEVTVEKPAGAEWSNCYYKFVYNVTVSSSDNKYIQFIGAKFYDK